MGELGGAKFLYLKCTMFFQKYYTIKNMKSITHFKNYKFKEQKKIHQTINNTYFWVHKLWVGFVFFTVFGISIIYHNSNF